MTAPVLHVVEGTPIDLPHSLEAEQALLGALLISTAPAAAVSLILKPEHFFEDLHGVIYRAVEDLCAKGRPTDLLTVSAVLSSVELPQGAPPIRAYLARIAADAVTVRDAPAWAAMIRDLAHRREIITKAAELTSAAREGGIETSGADLLDSFSEGTKHISEARSQVTEETTPALAWRIVSEIDAARNGEFKVDAFTTGFVPLDDLTLYRPGEVIVTAGRPGQGKAQPKWCKIKTEDGWTTFGEVKVGDRLASIDGKENVVVGVHQRGMLQTYKVTLSDGRSTFCCGDHLWEVRYRDWNSSRVLSTDKLINMLSRGRYKNRLIVRRASGEFGHTRALPVHPWLLGAIIGNGAIAHGMVGFSTADEETLERVRASLPDGLSPKSDGSKYCYRLAGERGNGPNQLKDALSALGMMGKKSPEKRIPETYLLASRASRMCLLQGLMDTDGWAEKDGTVFYATSSDWLADDVCALAWSLGFWTTRRVRKAYVHDGSGGKEQKLDCHQVCISGPGIEEVFLLSRKRERASNRKRFRQTNIVSIEPADVEDCVCISVSHPSRLYLTDDYIVTHNSVFATCSARRQAESGIGVLEFPLEIGREQAIARHIADLAYDDASPVFFSWILNRDVRNPEHSERIAYAVRAFERLPIVVDDAERITVPRLHARVRQAKAEMAAAGLRLGVVILDHLDFIDASDRYAGNRVQEIGEVMKGLKAIARREKVVVHLFCQLNRGVEGRDDKRPQLSDLRNSGEIEQVADVVQFVFREAYYIERSSAYLASDVDAHARMAECADVLEIITQKSRTSRVGVTRLTINPGANFIGWRLT